MIMLRRLFRKRRFEMHASSSRSTSMLSIGVFLMLHWSNLGRSPASRSCGERSQTHSPWHRSCRLCHCEPDIRSPGGAREWKMMPSACYVHCRRRPSLPLLKPQAPLSQWPTPRARSPPIRAPHFLPAQATKFLSFQI